MKFGATLSRRSVPQWRIHNLDYDEIKNLIKIQTSSQEGCSRDFEKKLLAVLDSELERVPPRPSLNTEGLIVCRSMNLFVAKLEKLKDVFLLAREPSKLYPERLEMIPTITMLR